MPSAPFTMLESQRTAILSGSGTRFDSQMWFAIQGSLKPAQGRSWSPLPCDSKANIALEFVLKSPWLEIDATEGVLSTSSGIVSVAQTF